ADEHGELAAVLDQVRALATSLTARLERLQDDPARVEQLNDRVAVLQALVRKHGHVLADVLVRREALEAELAALRADEELATSVEDQLEGTDAALGAAEHAVLKLRTEAGTSLERAVSARLPSLAMPHARFVVRVGGPAGEDVQFAFAGSAAFEPAPLADAASGGELSRVMLGLTLATHAGAGCLVFDEVDAGVGGATAKALATCLEELARDAQVLVVTHLATVAARATRHLVVARGATPDAPATIVPVQGEARVSEVARMLAGDPADPVAREHAAALLAGDPAAS
ncbi:MAG TPA: hypothetical protein VKT18_10310, partial [Acidimicrobiales bacterium]|nr:hypothetical protein [Acidimicrobiales bacterium]